MKKVIFAFFVLVFLSMNAFSQTPPALIKVKAELIDFKERHAWSEAGKPNVNKVAPLARFKVVEPKEYCDKTVGIIFSPQDMIMTVQLRINIGKSYTFEVPKDYFDRNFSQIYDTYIKNFKNEL